MIRLKASLAHFLLSICVVSLAMLIVFIVWYPTPYNYTNNILLIIQILVGVDIVLGPLLTFVVFNLKKPRKELKRDLAIIATVQICALAYGLFTLYVQRPVYTVFAIDRFEVLGDYDVEQENASPDLGTMPLRGPQYVYLRPPRDSAEQSKLIEALVEDQLEMVAMPDRYLKIAPNLESIAKRELSVDELASAASNRSLEKEIARLRAYAAEHSKQQMFHVLQGRQRDLIVAVDRQTGEFREFFKLHPWEAVAAVEKRVRSAVPVSVSD